MKPNRSNIFDWSTQGRIADGKLRTALELAGVLPDKNDWRRFLDQMLLFMGVVMLAAGVIFFFAFNWQELGRTAKFALVEIPVIGTLFCLWKVGVDSRVGKATILFASLLVGALLALVGQTYQTGADTFELFSTWAALILPWTLVARFPALWIVWLGLVNVASLLYLTTFGFFGSVLFASEKLLWILLGLNTAALGIWETLAATKFTWLRERWAIRIIATASGTLATALAVNGIVESHDSCVLSVAAWLAWLAGAYFAYRRWRRDVYVLAVGVLSAIVIIVTLMVRAMGDANAALFLFIGLVVIGLSAVGGYWLKQVAAEDER